MESTGTNESQTYSILCRGVAASARGWLRGRIATWDTPIYARQSAMLSWCIATMLNPHSGQPAAPMSFTKRQSQTLRTRGSGNCFVITCSDCMYSSPTGMTNRPPSASWW